MAIARRLAWRRGASAATGREVLIRETLLWTLPGSLGVGLLALFDRIGVDGILVAALVGTAVAYLLARARLRETAALADRARSLARGEEAAALPDAVGPGTVELSRSMTELGREVRRRAAQVAAQQRMLDTLIEALPDPILVVDHELTVLHANAAAKRSFDGPAPPVPLARILRDPGLLAAVSSALAGTAASSVSFSPTHDRTKQFTSRIEPVALGSGGRGALIALREQTEQVMIERMRSDFVANASHEIRTPLASIQGFIETLRGPARHDPAARESFLEIMGEEASRMSRLVDDLLSLSRIELAAHQPPRERCDVAEAVQYAVDRMQSVAELGHVRLVVEMPDSLPVVVGDADQLHQLFVNLIDNAIKYGGEDTTVTIAAHQGAAAPGESGASPRRACVRGAAIQPEAGQAAEHIPRLTERFYRVDGGRGRRQRGTGLGLAIVKHILRRHQGHLAIDSRPGAGSTFAVLLPVATEPVTGLS